MSYTDVLKPTMPHSSRTILNCEPLSNRYDLHP